MTRLGKGNSRIPDAYCETSTLLCIAGLPEGLGNCSSNMKIEKRRGTWNSKDRISQVWAQTGSGIKWKWNLKKTSTYQT